MPTSSEIAAPPRADASPHHWPWLVLKCMRPYQWHKNAFVIAPAIFGMKLGDAAAMGKIGVAFAAFCLLSSGVYIVNDLLDAEADREHPTKRHRPIASRELPAAVAFGAVIALWLTGLLLAWSINYSLLGVSLGYIFLSLGYCLGAKHLIILDAMSIAAGFVLRVLAGSAACGVTPTHWLILCTFLLAFYLALAKRRQELVLLSDNASKHRRALDDYSLPFLDQAITIVIGATIVSYALYTVAPETVARFGTDKLIYGTVFVIYGVLRYLALTRHTSATGDPSRLALTDWPLLVTLLAWGIYNVSVIYFPIEEFFQAPR